MKVEIKQASKSSDERPDFDGDLEEVEGDYYGIRYVAEVDSVEEAMEKCDNHSFVIDRFDGEQVGDHEVECSVTIYDYYIE